MNLQILWGDFMLKIIIGFPSKAIPGYTGFIGSVFLSEKCVETDISKRIVKEIDKSEVISANSIISPVLGNIGYPKLSGGAQCLIILANTNEIVPLHFMGDNCFSILHELSIDRDIIVSTGDIRDLFSWGFEEVYIINSGRTIHNVIEFSQEIQFAREKNYEPYSVRKHIDYFKARDMEGIF